MGLPDTSPTPKKDSMGMDYLPVYEGEQDDDSSVKVSAGKLQKAGVQTEVAERRTLNTMVRAPGTVQEDERRKSVVSLRFEGFIDTVENVTTGTHVHKGQPLMRIYGPNLSSAAAEYLSALNARPDAGISNQALKGARRRLENLDAPEKFIADIERTREIPALCELACAAGRRDRGADCRQRHARSTGRRAVPDRRSRRRLGDGRCR